MAKQGRTIVQTIHQPNSDIFNNFDKLMLLAKGKVMYCNDSSKSVDYFKSIGFPTPELSNPSDYFMSIMSRESIELEKEMCGDFNMDDLEARYRERIEHFVNGYEKSDLANRPDKIIEESEVKPIEIEHGSYNRTSWCYEFKLLAQRNWLNQVRLPHVTITRFFTTVTLGIIMVLIYSPLDGSKSGVQNRNGILAMITISAGMSAIGNVGMIFPAERPVFLREVNNGMYRVSSYFWSKLLSELPNSTLIPFVQGTITFWGTGMDSTVWYKYPKYMAIYWLIYNSFCGTGYILGALVANK